MSKKAELWTRMSTLTWANRGHWELELEMVLACKEITGVRVNIGMSGADYANDIAAGDAPDTLPNLTNLEYVVRRIAACGLKLLLGLGGDGPPMSEEFWIILAGGTWLDVKRPPLTASLDFVNATRSLKQKVINKVDEIYRSFGLNPYDYVFLELYNEPAIGGAGAPADGSFYSDSGMTYESSKGKWDIAADYASFAAGEGAPFLEYFTREVEGLDFLGMRVVSPTFTAIELDEELATFDRAATNGKKWIDVVRANDGFVELIFGINCYYEGFDKRTTGLHPELYAAPNLGPVEYAEMALYGDDYRGAKSGDGQCILRKLAKLRDEPRIGRSRIGICESGVNPLQMGMAGDSGSPSLGDMSFYYFVNFQKVGEAQLMVLDGLRQQDLAFVCHFSLTNVSSTWSQYYGLYVNDIDVAETPTLARFQTFASWLAWAKREGLPLSIIVDNTTPPPASATVGGAFYLRTLKQGDYETF